MCNGKWFYGQNSMITFNDVRKTTSYTFFFFPDGMHNVLIHFLTLNGFSEEQDFIILSFSETKQRYPNMDIPLVPNHPSLAGNPNTYAEPITMVSRMDVKDLERKLWEIDGSEEAMVWDEQCVNEMLDEEQTRNRHLEGWSPGLTRENETVR